MWAEHLVGSQIGSKIGCETPSRPGLLPKVTECHSAQAPVPICLTPVRSLLISRGAQPSSLPPADDAAAWQMPQYGAAPFVVEVQSRNQSVPQLRRKMEEWIEGGSQLGWLILPLQKQVEIYRSYREPEVLIDPTTLSGEDVMPGLVIAMSDVWI